MCVQVNHSILRSGIESGSHGTQTSAFYCVTTLKAISTAIGSFHANEFTRAESIMLGKSEGASAGGGIAV